MIALRLGANGPRLAPEVYVVRVVADGQFNASVENNAKKILYETGPAVFCFHSGGVIR